MKSNWTRRWWARIHATLVWRRFRERALLRAQRRSRRDRMRRSGLARLDGLARLEPRMLLAADIATDRFDYAPGSTALITTFSDGGPDHNFQVGETIQFQVVRTDGLADNPPGNLPWQVTDGVGASTPTSTKPASALPPTVTASPTAGLRPTGSSAASMPTRASRFGPRGLSPARWRPRPSTIRRS